MQRELELKSDRQRKGLAECVAIGTGLPYRILRNRALPVDEATMRRWMEVWEEVQRTTHEIEPFLATEGER